MRECLALIFVMTAACAADDDAPPDLVPYPIEPEYKLTWGPATLINVMTGEGHPVECTPETCPSLSYTSKLSAERLPPPPGLSEYWSQVKLRFWLTDTSWRKLDGSPIHVDDAGASISIGAQADGAFGVRLSFILEQASGSTDWTAPVVWRFGNTELSRNVTASL
jgi:hypothetical protein